MVRVKYPVRVLADKEFCKWLINYKDKEKQLIRLTHIKASSEDHKKEHNLIPDEDFKEIVKSRLISEFNFRAAFKPISIPTYVSSVLKDRVDQMVVWAIILATEPPFKTVILTTKENEKKYISSPHYQSVKSIIIKSEEEALQYIEILWRIFLTERMMEH